MSNLKYKHTAYTSAQWASLNPVIVENEIVIESDTKRTKIGNGISTYNELEYADANSVGNSLGSIKPTDAAPTPARNGNYTFSIGGAKPAWLTAEAGVTTVKAGDGVAVVYSAPSTYSYTHVKIDRIADIYNVTVEIPLAAGQYYTPATARAAVPVINRAKGKELTYETSAGVWVKEKFVGSDVANWTGDLNWRTIRQSNIIIYSYGTTTFITKTVGPNGRAAFVVPTGIIVKILQTNGTAPFNYIKDMTYEFSGSYKVFGIDLTQGLIQGDKFQLIEKDFSDSVVFDTEKFIPIAWIWDETAKNITYSPHIARNVGGGVLIGNIETEVFDHIKNNYGATNVNVFSYGVVGKFTVNGKVVTIPAGINIQIRYSDGTMGYVKLPSTFTFSDKYTQVGIDLTTEKPTDGDFCTLKEYSLFHEGALISNSFFPIATYWDNRVIFNSKFIQFIDPAFLFDINSSDFKWTSNKQLNLSDSVKSQLATIPTSNQELNPNSLNKNYVDLSHTITGLPATNWASDGGTVSVVAKPSLFKTSSSIKSVLKYSFSTASPLRLRTINEGTELINYLKRNPSSTLRLEMEIYTINPNVANRLKVQLWASDGTNSGFSTITTPSSIAGRQVVQVNFEPPASLIDWTNVKTIKVWIDTTSGSAEDIYIGNVLIGIYEEDNVHRSIDNLSNSITSLSSNIDSQKSVTKILLSGDSTFQMQSVLGQTYNNQNTNWVGLVQERFLKEKGIYINPLNCNYVLNGGGSKVDDYPGKTPTYSPIVLANGLLGNTRKITGINSYLEFDIYSQMVNIVIAKDKVNTNAGIIGVYSDGIKIGEIDTMNQYFKTHPNIVITGDGVTKDFDLGELNVDVSQITFGATTYNRFTDIGYESDPDYSLTTLTDALGNAMQAIIYKRGVDDEARVTNWVRFRTAPPVGQVNVICQIAKYIEYADSNITDSLEQVGTRDRGALQARKTNQDAIYPFYLGAMANHNIKLKIESGTGTPYLWFQGAYTANMDFISFGNGGGRVQHWLGKAGSQTEHWKNENIFSELSYEPDILITGYGTNDSTSYNTFLALRTITGMTDAQVSKLNALDIQSVSGSTNNRTVVVRNNLIDAISFDTVQCNNLIGNTAIIEGSIVIIGTFRWSAYNCQERIVKSFDPITGTITVDKAWNNDDIERINGYRGNLQDLVGQDLIVRNWDALEIQYNEAITRYREKSPKTKIHITGLGLSSYRKRYNQGFDTVLKRISSNRNCGFIDIKKAIWLVEKAQSKDWNQTLTANGSQSYVLNKNYVEFPEVTLNGVKYNDCYIKMYSGYTLNPVTTISDHNDGTIGTDTALPCELVFIGTPPASGTIVVKALTNVWSTDYTHPYGSSKATIAYAQAVSKAINNSLAINQTNLCRYETKWFDISQGQNLSIPNYAGTNKARFEIISQDNSGNILSSTPGLNGSGANIGIAISQVNTDAIILQAGADGIGNLMSGSGVQTLILTGKVKINFI